MIVSQNSLAMLVRQSVITAHQSCRRGTAAGAQHRSPPSLRRARIEAIGAKYRAVGTAPLYTIRFRLLGPP
jgi:hypothetical protein